MSRETLQSAIFLLVLAPCSAALAQITDVEAGNVWTQPFALATYAVGILFVALLIALPKRARRRERALALVKLDASDRELRMVLASSRCELWRYDLAAQTLQRENVLGSLPNFPDSVPVSVDRLFRAMHPEDLPGFRQAMLDHLHGALETFEAIYRLEDAPGHYLWLRSSGKVDRRDAWGKPQMVSGTTIDITELKRHELALAEANRQLNVRLLEIDRARAEITAIEDQRMLALWGSGCEFFQADVPNNRLHRENRIEGLAANEAGDSMSVIWDFLHPEDTGAFNEAFVAHVKGFAPFFDVTYRARCINQSWRWIQTRGRIVGRDAAGRATIIAGTNYDVSELKNAEIDLKHSAEVLEHRVEERTAELSAALEVLRRTQHQLIENEKMAALGGLVAGVAHEINTPLGIGLTAASHLDEISQRLQAKISANTLKKSDFDDFAVQAKTSVQLVMSNLRRASELVKSFKQVAVDQSNEEQRVIELHSYLHDILNSLRPSLKRFKHHVRIEAEPGIMWRSFPGALYQITANLVLNAVTHAFEPDQPGEIVIRARRLEALVEFSVADDGVGMSAEVAKRIFEPFFTTKRGQGGSGLGLHIVFNLVTNVLGGSISVQTQPGQGSKFVILAPLERPDRIEASNQGK